MENRRKIKKQLLMSISDMHLYSTSRESAIRLVISAISVLIGIMVPVWQPDSNIVSINAACFVYSIGVLIDFFIGLRPRQYFPGRLLTLFFYSGAAYSTIFSLVQIMLKEKHMLIIQPYYVILLMLIVQIIDMFLHWLVRYNPTIEVGKEEKNGKELRDAFSENAFKGNLGEVDNIR